MSDPRTTVLMDAPVAGAAGLGAIDGVVVVPRGSGHAGYADAMAEAVASAPPGSVVLARPPWVDPPAAALAAISMLLGRDLVWLPPDLAEAGWAAALIATWAVDVADRDLIRRAQVAVGLASLSACRLPQRPWGCEGVHMPALVAGSLARWCDRLWRPCMRCTRGGGAPGAPCARCAHREPAP